jgi:sugar phosphate isomerase/epimerase
MIKIAAIVGTPDLRQETLAVYAGDLEEAFMRLSQLGYDGVELMTRDPDQLDGDSIRRSLDANQLTLAGLCSGHVFGEDGLGLVGPDPQVCQQAMKRLMRFVDFAAGFGPGTLVNIGRSRGPGLAEDRPGTLDKMAAAFRQLAEYAASSGVRLVLEPINVLQTSFIHTSQDGIEMVRRVNHPNFRLMLDTYHMNIEDVDIYASLRQAAPYLSFVHFADNNRHWPGSAHLDFEKIIAVLGETGYDGFASLEILPWPDPNEAARASIESLRRYINPA